MVGDGRGQIPLGCAQASLEMFGSDLARFGLSMGTEDDLLNWLERWPNLLATFMYRLSRELFKQGIAELPDILSVAARVVTGVELYYSAQIGPGLKLIHGVGTVIGAGCRIGSRFTIYQGVTVGDKLGRETGGRPIIGDDVIASAGSQILGPVAIGSRVVIAANAVVIRSAPDRCVLAGVPAVVKTDGLTDKAYGEFLAAIKG